jgi:hypothetical protein
LDITIKEKSTNQQEKKKQCQFLKSYQTRCETSNDANAKKI